MALVFQFAAQVDNACWAHQRARVHVALDYHPVKWSRDRQVLSVNARGLVTVPAVEATVVGSRE
jgi:hypothetical protein